MPHIVSLEQAEEIIKNAVRVLVSIDLNHVDHTSYKEKNSFSFKHTSYFLSCESC